MKHTHKKSMIIMAALGLLVGCSAEKGEDTVKPRQVLKNESTPRSNASTSSKESEEENGLSALDKMNEDMKKFHEEQTAQREKLAAEERAHTEEMKAKQIAADLTRDDQRREDDLLHTASQMAIIQGFGELMLKANNGGELTDAECEAIENFASPDSISAQVEKINNYKQAQLDSQKEKEAAAEEPEGVTLSDVVDAGVGAGVIPEDLRETLKDAGAEDAAEASQTDSGN